MIISIPKVWSRAYWRGLKDRSAKAASSVIASREAHRISAARKLQEEQERLYAICVYRTKIGRILENSVKYTDGCGMTGRIKELGDLDGTIPPDKNPEEFINKFASLKSAIDIDALNLKRLSKATNELMRRWHLASAIIKDNYLDNPNFPPLDILNAQTRTDGILKYDVTTDNIIGLAEALVGEPVIEDKRING